MAQPTVVRALRYVADAVLANEIFDIHIASQRTCGQPRLLGQLLHRGSRVSGKRVARIMAECGLVGSMAARSGVVAAPLAQRQDRI